MKNAGPYPAGAPAFAGATVSVSDIFAIRETAPHLLTGHIVTGMVTADDLGRAIERGKGKAELATVGGSNLSFSRDGDSIVVTDAAGGRALVTGAEQLASNGVVHSVDGVLRGK